MNNLNYELKDLERLYQEKEYENSFFIDGEEDLEDLDTNEFSKYEYYFDDVSKEMIRRELVL